MRIVSYNVRYFGHALKGLASTAGAKEAIASALAGLDPQPDLVALQEVETRSIRAHAVHRGAHPRETQLEAFLRHLSQAFRDAGRPMPYRAFYFPAHEYRLGPIKFYTTGLAVLSNAETVGVVASNGDRPHRISSNRDLPLKTLKQTRIAAHLHLEDAHGRKFHLFNTHLSLPSPWAREFWSQEGKMGHGKNQVAEASLVLSYARQQAKSEPFLVVGDFNAAPSTPVYLAITDQGLRGAQASLGLIDAADPKGFPTAGFLQLRMHLDHVFATPGVTFVDMRDTRPFGDAGGPFHGLSDHVPLLTTFELGR